MKAQRRHDLHILKLRQEEDRRTAIASKLEFLKRQHDIAVDTVVEDCRQDVREMRANAADAKGLPQGWANNALWACTHENKQARLRWITEGASAEAKELRLALVEEEKRRRLDRDDRMQVMRKRDEPGTFAATAAAAAVVSGATSGPQPFPQPIFARSAVPPVSTVPVSATRSLPSSLSRRLPRHCPASTCRAPHPPACRPACHADCSASTCRATAGCLLSDPWVFAKIPFCAGQRSTRLQLPWPWLSLIVAHGITHTVACSVSRCLPLPACLHCVPLNETAPNETAHNALQPALRGLGLIIMHVCVQRLLPAHPR